MRGRFGGSRECRGAEGYLATASVPNKRLRSQPPASLPSLQYAKLAQSTKRVTVCVSLPLFAMSFRQPQNEGVCLRFPDDFPPHPTFSHEVAAQMLLRAIQLSMQVAFTWQFIDKPTGRRNIQALTLITLGRSLTSQYRSSSLDGQLILLFMVPQLPFPIDGLRYLDQEQRYNIPLGNNRVRIYVPPISRLPNSSSFPAICQ